MKNKFTLGVMFLLMVMMPVVAQADMWEFLADKNVDDLNVFTHTFSEGETLGSIDEDLMTPTQILNWMLNVYNIELSKGDILTLVEDKFSIEVDPTLADKYDVYNYHDGVVDIYYPLAWKINYANAKYRDETFIAKEIDDQTDYIYPRLYLEYNDQNGDLRRTIYLSAAIENSTGRWSLLPNPKMESGLYTLKVYEFEFVLDGYIQDYHMSRDVGPSKNPFTGDYEIHRGGDFDVTIGTPLHTPYYGTIEIGYDRSDSIPVDYNHLDPDRDLDGGKVAVFNTNFLYLNSNGIREDVEIKFTYLHMSSFREDLKNLILNAHMARTVVAEKRDAIRNWWNDLLVAKDEKKIIRTLDFDKYGNRREYSIFNRIFNGDYIGKIHELIGFSGNTGRSISPHLHLGIFLNGSTDPTSVREFYESFGKRKDLSKDEMKPALEWFGKITLPAAIRNDFLNNPDKYEVGNGLL